MTEQEEMLALADDYEAGLQKCAASGYEEYGPDFQRRQQLIINALRDRAQGRPSKFSPGDPVEVRNQNDEIDEIIIRRGDVHIEQMSSDGWFMGIDAEDGSYWQFWFGSKNRKSHVEFRHTETASAAEQESSLSSTPGQAIERTPTHVSWLDADYNKARDCMIGLLRGHGWTISENSVGVKEFDNAFQHAVGILALTASTGSISVNLPFERLPQHAGDPGFGPVPNIIPLGSSDPNHPSNIAAVTSTPAQRAPDIENRITVLSNALKSISKNTCCDNCREAAMVARSALASYVGLAREPAQQARPAPTNSRYSTERLEMQLMDTFNVNGDQVFYQASKRLEEQRLELATLSSAGRK